MEANLVARAVREEWPISAANKIKAVETLTNVINNPDIPYKAKLAAIKTLSALDGLNVRREQIREMAKPKHLIVSQLSTEEIMAKIKEKFEELGIEPPAQALLENMG